MLLRLVLRTLLLLLLLDLRLLLRWRLLHRPTARGARYDMLLIILLGHCFARLIVIAR